MKNIKVPEKGTGKDLVWVVVIPKKEKEDFHGHVILHFSYGLQQQYLHFICISDDVILILLPSEWSEHTILCPTEESGRDAM